MTACSSVTGTTRMLNLLLARHRRSPAHHPSMMVHHGAGYHRLRDADVMVIVVPMIVATMVVAGRHGDRHDAIGVV